MSYDHVITNEQCLKLIEKKIKTKQFSLINFTIKPISEKPNGYLGTHLFGIFEILNNEKSQTLKFFMKMKLDETNDLSCSKLSTEDNDVYIRESEFLKLVTNKYHVDWAPQFYDYLNNNLLILEDLSERGFKLSDLEEYDLNHCHVVLNTLANYHAFSFKYIHDKKQENNEYSILNEYPYFFKEVLFQMDTEIGQKWMKSTKGAMDYLIDQLPQKNISIDELKRKFNEKYDQLCNDIKPVENRYHVISHGDLWGNNIMFSYENGQPEKCCLVDYQLLRYLPPTCDVQFFLAVNTSPSFREKHSRELLDYYYKRLTHELNVVGLDANDIYPKEIFKTACKDTILPFMIIACAYKSFLLMNRDKMNSYMKDEIKGEDIMYGDRVKYIKEELENDQVYKQKISHEFQLLINELTNQLL